MKKLILSIMLPCVFFVVGNIQAQTVINSLSELKSHLDTDDGNFIMTPGTYYFNESNCGPGKLFSDPRLLLFTGNRSTFDFTDVKFEIDTKIFTLYGNIDIIEFWPVGSNNIYKNLTLEDIGNTVPTKGAGTLHLDGADNLVEGFKTTTRGSFPYGYGDIFGKGGGSVISHNKHAGMLVRGDRNHLKNCTVLMRAYGHGIFVQGSHDAIIEGCYVEGELRTVGEVLQEEGTDSPADQVGFQTVWGYDLRDLTSDYTFSLQEAGIRAYSTGVIFDADGNSTGVDRGTENTTVIDCKIVKMRVGVNTGAEGGDNKRIENCVALACESGFWLGSDGDVINCSADASVGPVLSEDIARGNATYEVTLLDNYIPKIGDAPYFYMGGSNHNITINDGTTYYNPDIAIVLGGSNKRHRFLEGSVEDVPSRSANNITLTNNTKYPLILEDATDCTIFSCTDVTDNGTRNSITQQTDCDFERECMNTADNLQAECYDDMLGVAIQDMPSNTYEKQLIGIQSGDWIRFNNIDLTGKFVAEATVSSEKGGASIEVREASPEGRLLGVIPISNTNDYSNYQMFSADLDQSVNGSIDVFFVFKHASETGWLFNLDKLAFAEDPCATANHNAYLPISAEHYCASSGVVLEARSDFNQVVSNIENEDYLRFSNVNFGTDDVYNAIDVLASSETTGGTIEVRSGAVDGTLLATVTVGNTGSWNTYDKFSGFTNANITGIHDIYLVFKGTSGFLFNLDNFHFNNDTCSGKEYMAYNRIDALDYCEMFGVVPIGTDYLGGINDNEWIRYGSMDFSSEAPPFVTFNVAGYPTEDTVEEGFINVMLDHPEDGVMIATITVPKTGGWEVWEEVTTALIEEVTGIHDVYFYFGNGAFNIDWFEFHQEKVELDNLALASNGSIASQSSTDYEGEAIRAIDGNTNGDFGGSSVTHTEHGAEGVLKWWQVDLGADKSIDEIIIYNRAGGNGEALKEFTVEIIKDNGDAETVYYGETHPNPSVAINVAGKVGRIVKISKTSDRAIMLAEVEVYGSNTLSMNDFIFDNIKLYPNPATNEITISNGNNLTLEIYNINGTLESKLQISEHEKIIAIGHLSSGVHFLKFSNQQGSIVKKLIKL